MRAAALVALGTILPLAAVAQNQTPDLPRYFVVAVFEVSTAQNVARSCKTLSIDPILAARRTETVLEQLTEDGFTPENIEARMSDPSDAIAWLQDDFLFRHNLKDGAAEADVCAAGRKEMGNGTGIGALLLEVTE